MPNVNIQLCKFHVMQAFGRKIKKSALDEEGRNHLTMCIRDVVYARTEITFTENLGKVAKIAPPSFMSYYYMHYYMHWGPCKHYWGSYLTNCDINLGNTTNNCIQRKDKTSTSS